MSYSRQYSEVVSGTGSETVHVSYPASQSGGTVSRTVTVRVDIPVHVNIHVDTNPFDHSVRHCEQNIMMLTGAVVATESATIISKHRNAKKVGDTIVNGFFSYVRSEISQQVSEITQQTEALLMHIRDLSAACIAKKDQMEADYQRIASRYTKLFSDLNRELATRIHQLDQPAFLFKELADDLRAGAENNGSLSTIMVFNTENADVQVKLSSALAKNQAAGAMKKITGFLAQQKSADAAIGHCMQNDNLARAWYIPVCLAEITAGEGLVDKTTYVPPVIADMQKKDIIQRSAAAQLDWTAPGEENLRQLKFFFHKELNNRLPPTEQQNDRLRKMIQQLATIETIQTTS